MLNPICNHVAEPKFPWQLFKHFFVKLLLFLLCAWCLLRLPLLHIHFLVFIRDIQIIPQLIFCQPLTHLTAILNARLIKSIENKTKIGHSSENFGRCMHSPPQYGIAISFLLFGIPPCQSGLLYSSMINFFIQTIQPFKFAMNIFQRLIAIIFEANILHNHLMLNQYHPSCVSFGGAVSIEILHDRTWCSYRQETQSWIQRTSKRVCRLIVHDYIFSIETFSKKWLYI